MHLERVMDLVREFYRDHIPIPCGIQDLVKDLLKRLNWVGNRDIRMGEAQLAGISILLLDHSVSIPRIMLYFHLTVPFLQNLGHRLNLMVFFDTRLYLAKFTWDQLTNLAFIINRVEKTSQPPPQFMVE